MHDKKLFILLLILTVPLATNIYSNSVAPYFSKRSLSVNLPRQMAGLIDHINRFDTESFSINFAVAPGYAQSFRDEQIARCLFGNSLQNCDCPTINVSGSRVSDRGSCDWLADYFGLPTDFQGSITFKPRIKNFFIDFALHVGLDHWVDGMWFKIWAPFVHTRWDLNWCESCPSESTADHDPGYFNGADGVSNANLLSSAKQFFQECGTPTLGTGGGTTVTFEALKSCRWADCGCDTDLTDNGAADLRAALGWNFLQNENYHIGVGILAAAPTGTRPDSRYLFEPIIGNGHHWELGGVWTSHVIFWRSEDETRHFGGYLDANITHLFETRQKRCFDLCGKPMSRYMLAEKLQPSPVTLVVDNDLWGNPTAGGTQAGSTAPFAQFKNAFASVGNLTCAEVNVAVGVQADLVAMINYTHSGFSWDLGYNLWARSCESIELDCDCLPRLAKEKDTWALKGDVFVYGFSDGTNNVQTALSATQSNATIHKGTNNFIGDNLIASASGPGIVIDGTPVGPTRNPGIDNRFWAQTAPNNTGEAILDRVDGSVDPMPMQTNTSVNPVFITQSNIDLNGARTKGLSHSIFTHFSYSWLDKEMWTPFFGFGAQAEFSSNSNSDCKTDCESSCNTSCDTSCATSKCNPCDSCQRCSVSQWYIWVKGGFSFN